MSLNSSNFIIKIVQNFSNGIKMDKTEFGTIMYIDSYFFENNKIKVYETLIKYIKEYNGNEITISSSILIQPNVLKEIKENHNIKKVNLGSYDDRYLLTKNDFQTLICSSSIKKIITYGVEEQLECEEDRRIEYNSYKNVFLNYMFQELVNNKYIEIDKELSQEELEYIKYIPIGTNVIIDYNNCSNSDIVIDQLILIGHKVIIQNFLLKDKYRAKKYQDKIIIEDDGEEISLPTYIKIDKIIDMFVNDIKNSNLSVLEKFICAYNITKKFKKYCKSSKEDEKRNKRLSRTIYNTLFNNVMVCSGYTNMLKKICTKLEIPVEEIDCIYSKDNLNNDDVESHSIIAVKIKDEKYNIDNIFYSDPTSDNDLVNDYYNFVLYPPYQRKIVDPELNTKYSLLESDSEVCFASEYLNRQHAIIDFINLLKIIDKEFVLKLKDKCGDLESCSEEEIINNRQLLYELYNYTKNSNNVLDPNILISAIKEALKFVFPDILEEKINEEIDKIIATNEKRKYDMGELAPDISFDIKRNRNKK